MPSDDVKTSVSIITGDGERIELGSVDDLSKAPELLTKHWSQIMPASQQEQRVLSFAQATATASEIEKWRVSLAKAELNLDSLKEMLKSSAEFTDVETAKERVKELTARIADATSHLTSELANSAK